MKILSMLKEIAYLFLVILTPSLVTVSGFGHPSKENMQ